MYRNHHDDEESPHLVLDAGTGIRRVDELLGGRMSPPAFPIAPSDLQGSWSFESIDEGSHVIEGFDVVTREISTARVTEALGVALRADTVET